jgi:hypothetical protein
MSPSRVAACIGVGTLLVAWLASAVGVPRQARHARAPRPAPEDARVMALASDVQSQATRLRQRLASPTSLQPIARNPFSFAARERLRAEPAAAAVRIDEPPSLVEPIATEPELVLIGVAENTTAEGVVRTAMIAGGGDQLFMVIQGESVGGRYEVVAIGADAVELKDTTTGATRRLALR